MGRVIRFSLQMKGDEGPRRGDDGRLGIEQSAERSHRGHADGVTGRQTAMLPVALGTRESAEAGGRSAAFGLIDQADFHTRRRHAICV